MDQNKRTSGGRGKGGKKERKDETCMTFRVNARKSHSERRETLTPCLDWFSASSRVRCSFFFFSFFFSFFFLASRFFCSFFFLRVRSVGPRYLPLQPRRLFLPFAPIILLSAPSRLYTLSVLSFLLRTCTRSAVPLSLPPSSLFRHSSPFSRVSHTVISLAFLF